MTLAQRASRLIHCLFVCFTLIAAPMTALAADKVELSIDVSKAGAKMDRNIFGQFAEHLGHGIYDGIWGGPDSTIPNTRGIRQGVGAGLKARKAPDVLWRGGGLAVHSHGRR